MRTHRKPPIQTLLRGTTGSSLLPSMVSVESSLIIYCPTPCSVYPSLS